MPIILKYLITAGLVVLISEVARRSDKIGALIAALPMVTVLAMTWMFFEIKGPQQTEKIANHAWYTFWYVIPSLPMFLLMPWMMRKGISFPVSISTGIALTILLYLFMTKVLAKFGMNL